MSHWRYHHHGLRVFSDLELPEWAFCAVAADSSPCDVRIRLADREPEPLAEDFPFPVPHVAVFTIRGTSEIVAVPEPGVSSHRVRLFLTGSAWGALMYRRGALLIHASAIGTSLGAVAFCARSGSGKSTLAALLSSEGYPLISDDLCCVRMSRGEQPMLYPSVPRLRLWHDAAEELGWAASVREDDQFRSGKHLYMKRRSDCPDPQPLRALYILGWGAPAILHLQGFNAITRLLATATWRGELLLATGRPEEHFANCSALLRQVECWEFRRPRELSQLIENSRVLIRHISDPRR